MNFGLVSTRFAGTDGVSLESMKWATVLERAGHRCFWFSGLNDRSEECARVVPEAHFAHPRIVSIAERVWCRDAPDVDVEKEVASLRRHLRGEISDFVGSFAIDVLVPQNAVTIPMNLPLGLALADFIRSNNFPTIAHHHDFHWERERFSGEAARPWLEEAFPPSHPSLVHAVIHSGAARDLRERLGTDAVLVPNVMDFSAPSPPLSRQASVVRRSIGLAAGDRLVLQPTRVVPRKGIEHAIELVHRLGDPRNRLVVSHEAGDEGFVYRDQLDALAREKGVDLRFLDPGSPGVPRLEDLYQIASLVTFPSLYEGFGNALLEAVWFRKPVLVNRYPVFVSDIEPCGFDFIVMDGVVDNTTVASAARILSDSGSTRRTVEKNHAVASEHFGYDLLESRLRELLARLGFSL